MSESHYLFPNPKQDDYFVMGNQQGRFATIDKQARGIRMFLSIAFWDYVSWVHCSN